MNGYYELINQVSIMAMAVSVSVYVLAVSLLGQAIDKAAEDEEIKKKQQKSELEKGIEEIKKKISTSPPGDSLELKKLQKQLSNEQKKYDGLEREIARIKESPKDLTVEGAVVRPWICLTVVLLLCSNRLNYKFTVPASLEVFYLLCVLAGFFLALFFILKTLKTIEGVALVSSKALFKQNMEAFRSALEENANKNKPKLELEFANKPPFKVKVGSINPISFWVRLSNGDVARNPQVWFFAPKEFGFPEVRSWVQEATVGNFPHHLTTIVEVEDMQKAIRYSRSVKVKVPDTKGKFTLGYRLYCDGFASEPERIVVEVE